MLLPRRQLSVASPLSAQALIRGLITAITQSPKAHRKVADAVAQRFQARAVALVDSGTSALVQALRIGAGTNGTVAYPAYCCVDIIAAARLAGIKVRLYDLDPRTLSPNLESLREVLAQGVDAILVAHLYGIPADVNAVRQLATEFTDARGNTPVIIEDAAQGIGATLGAQHAGGIGDISILSFGRGKGVTGGAGGALLAIDARWESSVASFASALPPPNRGWTDWIKATATWILGRPSLYAIPAAIPGLHLGETVYHDAHEPLPLSLAAAAVLEHPFARIDSATQRRRNVSSALHECAEGSQGIQECRPAGEGRSGFLRYPIVQLSLPVRDFPARGIMRGYPRPLNQEPEIQSTLLESAGSYPGAEMLSSQLLTLPTHHFVSSRDVRQLCNWMHTL